MADAANPAWSHFLQNLKPETRWGELLIRQTPSGYELRHIADRDLPAAQLQQKDSSTFRELAQFNSQGQFRPLKSAPDLPSGWVACCSTPSALCGALEQVYPNSIVDWFYVALPNPPLTHYRDFTNRQSGMYRITAMLTDSQAVAVIRAACHPDFCLKRRLWTIEGLPPDSPETKSLIPCLEPCALLLELARKAMRIEQEPKMNVELSPSELETIILLAEESMKKSAHSLPAGEITSPLNPRRVQLVLEKLKNQVQPTSLKQPEE